MYGRGRISGAVPDGRRPPCTTRGDLGEPGVPHDRQPAHREFLPAARFRGGDREREARLAPCLALRLRQLPPGELGPVSGLRHLLASRHAELRVEPEDGGGRIGRGGRLGVVQVRTGHLELGELLRPAVERHRRVDPHLGLVARDRDSGQRAGLAPLRAARPPHHLPDPGVLPVAHHLGPLALARRPLVGEHHQHRPGGRAQRVGTGRGSRLLDVHHQRQYVLRCFVPVRPLGTEGAVRRQADGNGRGLGSVVAAHPSSLPVAPEPVLGGMKPSG